MTDDVGTDTQCEQSLGSHYSLRAKGALCGNFHTQRAVAAYAHSIDLRWTIDDGSTCLDTDGSQPAPLPCPSSPLHRGRQFNMHASA
jgi:hypothetical protein